jgi:hypothetical protein
MPRAGQTLRWEEEEKVQQVPAAYYWEGSERLWKGLKTRVLGGEAEWWRQEVA